MKTITFLNLNIWLGGKLFDQVFTFLKKENADIIHLQEVNNGSDTRWERQFRTLEFLKREFPSYYCVFAPHVLDRRPFGKVEQGNAIFSRFPIHADEVIFYDVAFGERSEEEEKDWSTWPCNLQHATIQVGGTKLHVFNTHGPWGIDGKDNPRRLRMSKVILQHIQMREHVILSGDFNVRPNTVTIQNIEHHLTNVFGNELISTFNMKRKDNPGYADSVVDMIFVSKNIKILEKDCPTVDVSDHLPLICKLEV